MNDVPNESFQCSECQAGMMHLQHITYFTWLDEELVTVPNFPAWVCDMCGRREYDAVRYHGWSPFSILKPARPARPNDGRARSRKNMTEPVLRLARNWCKVNRRDRGKLAYPQMNFQ